MKGFSNECGSRNTFGYFDACAGEIVLKRPCSKKNDLQEAYFWLDTCSDLKKFSLGIGAFEAFVQDGSSNSLYSTAKDLLKNSIIKHKCSDAEMLNNILLKLHKQTKLRSLAIKCFLFSDDQVLFEHLLELIIKLPELTYLDLTGCYFSDEQLISLALAVAKTKIAHMVWPDPKPNKSTLDEIVKALEFNKSLVVLTGAPLELLKLAQKNRDEIFSIGKYPSIINDEDIKLIKQYKNSIIIAFAYEKEKLLDLEKTFMAILAEVKDFTSHLDEFSA